jgi:vacuolar-type H+-ATPase subunit C/Vma6
LFKAGEIAATRDYQHMLSDIQREYGAAHSLSSLELTLDRSLLKANLRMLKRYTSFFNIGLILAFINLKWFEVRNLRAIVKGLEEGIPANEIKGILVLAD